MRRLQYWNRILRAYILSNTSQLTFWHGTPKVNKNVIANELGQYYMLFYEKANYNGNYDENGIPMLDYHGHIGLQYNPIAIAQWGLGNYNLWSETNENRYYIKFVKSANWLVDNLEKNTFGNQVWMHHFNFEYRDTLVSPWYSGLAQGQGLSVLTRAFNKIQDEKYKFAAQNAFQTFLSLKDQW